MHRKFYIFSMLLASFFFQPIFWISLAHTHLFAGWMSSQSQASIDFPHFSRCFASPTYERTCDMKRPFLKPSEARTQNYPWDMLTRNSPPHGSYWSPITLGWKCCRADFTFTLLSIRAVVVVLSALHVFSSDIHGGIARRKERLEWMFTSTLVMSM